MKQLIEVIKEAMTGQMTIEDIVSAISPHGDTRMLGEWDYNESTGILNFNGVSWIDAESMNIIDRWIKSGHKFRIDEAGHINLNNFNRSIWPQWLTGTLASQWHIMRPMVSSISGFDIRVHNSKHRIAGIESLASVTFDLSGTPLVLPGGKITSDDGKSVELRIRPFETGLGNNSTTDIGGLLNSIDFRCNPDPIKISYLWFGDPHKELPAYVDSCPLGECADRIIEWLENQAWTKNLKNMFISVRFIYTPEGRRTRTRYEAIFKKEGDKFVQRVAPWRLKPNE